MINSSSLPILLLYHHHHHIFSKGNYAMSFNRGQRSKVRDWGEKYTYSLTQCCPHSYKKNKLTLLPQKPLWHGGFPGPYRILLFMLRYLPGSDDWGRRWNRKPSAAQAAFPEEPSWKGAGPGEYKKKKQKVNRKLVPGPPVMWFPRCHLFKG